MEKNRSKNAIWFEGSNEMDCSIESVKHSQTNLGKYFEGVIGLMPGMIKVELVEQADDFVVIQTNEGLMKRTNISRHDTGNKIVIEFDEEYQAGKAIRTNAHFINEFETNENKVIHRLKISNLKAPGFLGFFYRTFGSSNMGKAFLNAHKTFLETTSK